MATFKLMSGIVGAGVIGGAIFVATTDGDASEIVAPGFIPWESGAALNKGDAIIFNYIDTNSNLRTDWFAVSSVSANTITLSILSGYGGSGMGNPEAGFHREYLGGNMGAGGGSFNLFTYNNAIDTMDIVIAADYFNDAADILRPGDVIYVTTEQGAAGVRGADLLKVTDVSGGVVTVAATDFKQFV